MRLDGGGQRLPRGLGVEYGLAAFEQVPGNIHDGTADAVAVHMHADGIQNAGIQGNAPGFAAGAGGDLAIHFDHDVAVQQIVDDVGDGHFGQPERDGQRMPGGGAMDSLMRLV